MVKVIVIEKFSYFGKFDLLKNLVRANTSKNDEGYLYVNDIFECTEDIAEYLTKTNKLNRPFVKILEVIPDIKNIEKKETKRKTTKKSIAKK